MHLFFRFYYLNLPLTRLYGTIKKCIITQLLFFFFIQVGAWLSSQSVKKDLCNADKWEQLCQSWVRSYPLFSSSSQKGWLWLHNTADILYICMIASALKSNTLASKKKYVEFFRSVLDPVFSLQIRIWISLFSESGSGSANNPDPIQKNPDQIGSVKKTF